jgi:hypothetical protein
VVFTEHPDNGGQLLQKWTKFQMKHINTSGMMRSIIIFTHLD